MSSHVVLDLGYGDSGKGKTVDWLCSQHQSEDPLVVRFSGGQQCGHTVINDRGKHVHGTFPSGTLRGCRGYIMASCTFSPVAAHNEYLALRAVCPQAAEQMLVVVDPLAHLTTPFEVVYNQVTEKRNNHGSCGMGVGATMRRNLQSPYKLHVVDLTNPWVLRQKMAQLAEYYHSQVSIDFDGNQWITMMFQFERAVEWVLKNLAIDHIDLEKRTHRGECTIFEGSQGILLDMDHGFFPHVTYASTTCKNIAHLLNFTDTTHYVIRNYQTRHGVGPFNSIGESDLGLKNTEQEINIPNEWQGSLRMGPLDWDLVKYAITVDQLYNPTSHPCLHVTCLDQYPDFQRARVPKQIFEVYTSSTPKSEYDYVF